MPFGVLWYLIIYLVNSLLKLGLPGVGAYNWKILNLEKPKEGGSHIFSQVQSSYQEHHLSKSVIRKHLKIKRKKTWTWGIFYSNKAQIEINIFSSL